MNKSQSSCEAQDYIFPKRLQHLTDLRDIFIQKLALIPSINLLNSLCPTSHSFAILADFRDLPRRISKFASSLTSVSQNSTFNQLFGMKGNLPPFLMYSLKNLYHPTVNSSHTHWSIWHLYISPLVQRRHSFIVILYLKKKTDEKLSCFGGIQMKNVGIWSSRSQCYGSFYFLVQF